MLKAISKKYFSGLTKNSVLPAFASLFSDISTEMLYPVLPVYLMQYLRANGSVIGIVDGIATAGVGWYSTIVGLSGLIAGIVAGLLWDKVSHASVFIYGAALSLSATFALLVLVPDTLHKNVQQ
jgi:MFS family permease